MLEFADVARPSIIHQRRHRIRRDGGDVLFHARGRPNEKVVHEWRDIFATVAQRRNGNDERPQSEIQVFAKRSRLDSLAQITVRGGHDSSVDLDTPFGAHAPDFAFLESPEELGLHGRSNLADLIQEDGTAARNLEKACFVSDRTRKRPSCVAEQLRFEECFSERSAVDADKGRRCTRALVVDQADDEFLARATFAINENRCVEWRDAGRQFQHILHRLAPGDEVP